MMTLGYRLKRIQIKKKTWVRIFFPLLEIKKRTFPQNMTEWPLSLSYFKKNLLPDNLKRFSSHYNGKGVWIFG